MHTEQTRKALRKQFKQFDLEGVSECSFYAYIKGDPDAQIEIHRASLQCGIRKRKNETSVTL